MMKSGKKKWVDHKKVIANKLGEARYLSYIYNVNIKK